MDKALKNLCKSAESVSSAFYLTLNYQNLTMTDAVGLHVMEQRRVASCWSTDFHLALGGVQLVINEVP